jgi:phage baseplate assembly protein W
MVALDSAADLVGVDLGGGDVHLAWTYPVDIAANLITFDLFGSTDPLDVFHTLYATAVGALKVDLTGQGFAGDRYFTVVARRGDLRSLPARVLLLPVRGPSTLATVTGGAGAVAVAADSGLGFPFGITGAGDVFAQGGDALLRSKLLQLLLTVPGERVNLPDYGTRLVDLVFDPNSDVLAATTEFMVSRAVQRYLGDEIQLDRVQITADDATLNVDIRYVKKVDLTAQQVRVGLPLPAETES